MTLFIAIAAREDWTVKTTEIKSAFLHGKELENIYIYIYIYIYILDHQKKVKTPKHAIWKLKHGLYGLKDGARQFYESVREELINP